MSERYPLWEFLIPPSRFGRTAVMEAEGTRVRLADGSWALCATSGLWNVNLGYANKAVTRAVSDALHSASYLSLFRQGHPTAVAAAQVLLDVARCGRDGRVLFSTSGGAANDMMMKLVRQYHAERGDVGRKIVVGLNGSYHGLTYGSFALTGERLGQPLYSVDQRAVRHIDVGDVPALTTLLNREGHRVAAVVLEPVLGTGAVELPAAFVDAVGALRDRHGFLLVADEVATGFGRLGSFFASDRWSACPDLLVTSKGLTNGTCAASALVVSAAVCDVFDRADSPFVHGETQAGTPASCAAILATVAQMHDLDICARSRSLSAALDGVLNRLSRHPLVAGTRGEGCFRALVLHQPDAAGPLVTSAREQGVIVQPGPDGVQLVPQLVYGAAEVEELEDTVRAALDRVAEGLGT